MPHPNTSKEERKCEGCTMFEKLRVHSFSCPIRSQKIEIAFSETKCGTEPTGCTHCDPGSPGEQGPPGIPSNKTEDDEMPYCGFCGPCPKGKHNSHCPKPIPFYPNSPKEIWEEEFNKKFDVFWNEPAAPTRWAEKDAQKEWTLNFIRFHENKIREEIWSRMHAEVKIDPSMSAIGLLNIMRDTLSQENHGK